MRTFTVILLICLCAFVSARSALRQKRSDDNVGKKGQSDALPILEFSQNKGDILKHISNVNGQFLDKLLSLGADLPDSHEDLEEHVFPEDFSEKVKAAAESFDEFVGLDEKMVKDIGDPSEDVKNFIMDYARKEGCTREQITEVVKTDGACVGLYRAGHCLYKAVEGIRYFAYEPKISTEGKLKKIKFIVKLVKGEEKAFKDLAKSCHSEPDFAQEKDTEKRILRKLEELLLSREST